LKARLAPDRPPRAGRRGIGRLAAETGAGSVFWNRRYEPAAIARDKRVKSDLRARGLLAESFNGSLLFEPWTVANQAGQPYRVFTAFWRECMKRSIPPRVADAPRRLPAPGKWPASLADCRPSTRAGHRLGRRISRGMAARRSRSHPPIAALRERIGGPLRNRSRPPRHRRHLASFAALAFRRDRSGADLARRAVHPGVSPPAYLARVRVSPAVPFSGNDDQPLRPEFAKFPWKSDRKLFRAWTSGKTGYPLVDAGMRELWHTGWMHNRVRMVVASFLVKHLLIGWQEGAAWFWDTLVDADLANNTLGWQWVAGCGADAAPYFRIFNPTLQAAKFDPEGAYVGRWAPDSATLAPIVDHGEARRRALEALASIR
jgi:deoxyribodipyrimidine photo-lyase